MDIHNLYKEIISDKEAWNYYNKNLKMVDIEDVEDCENFIRQFIDYSEKSKMILAKNIEYLKNVKPKRLSHIVSMFFLGLWFFNNENDFFRSLIIEELSQLNCFHNRRDDIKRQFTYIWFMASFFHDLGYKAEDNIKGENLPHYNIPDTYKSSVPSFYKNVYKNYYKYRNKKEHGIYAGLNFDKDICEIRKLQEHNPKSTLYWNKEIEELYHYIAWIILSHNIWMIRDDNKNIEEYKKYNLNELILSSEIDTNYKINIKEYPLFCFFCIVDSIEPLKNNNRFPKIQIKYKKSKIIIKTNNSEFRQKIQQLKDWLFPVKSCGEEIIISLEQ